MESSNLQHQLQELFVGYSSLVSAPPITHDCNPNIILDGNSYNNPYLVDQSLACSRENENNWFNFSSNYHQQQTNDHEHQQQQQLSTLYSSIQSPASYGGFQGISAAGSNHNNNTNYYYSNNNNNNHVIFSSSSRNNNNNSSSSNSTLDLLSSSSFSSSMGYNLQVDHHRRHLDFLAAPNYNSSAFNKSAHLQDYSINNNNSPSNSSNKCKLMCDTTPILQTSSTISTHVARAAKRPVNSLQCSVPKKSNNSESISKKSCRSSSCPPLKVRKEKLGDRISALQRLVAPFGKTDTSSVLTEAIGYIQFLHDQVETLSMPYLASSQTQTKPYQKLHPGSIIQEDNGNGTKPARQDLRSRGLCLMPLSCASFIHGYD